MSKKWMLIAGGVALVVVAIVAAVVLSGGTSPQANSNTDGSSSATSSASPGTGNTGGTTTTSGTTPSNGAASGGGTGSNSVALKPFPALPDPGIPARTVTAPAAPGETLAPLTQAPDPTISGLKLGLIPDGSQYEIRMRPYGIGPSIVFGSRLAIRVDSAEPVGKAPANSQIVNANILALVDTTNGGTVTKGGTYTATLIFRSDGTRLLPVLSKAVAEK